MATPRLTERQRRSVVCPVCDARIGRPCVSSRIPSAASFGGGWGGYPALDREHPARVAEARADLYPAAPAAPAATAALLPADPSAYTYGAWSWGYSPAMTHEHAAYWGARAIWRGDGPMDLLPDRQSVLARSEADAKRLVVLLNAGARAAANRRLAALANRWEVSPREAAEVVLHDDGTVRIVANTNASHGYLYVTAQLLS